MIDEQGFRLNVGIILANADKRLFWGRRVGSIEAWQFPQGGIKAQEPPEQAMYRELYEELGLEAKQVKLLGQTSQWLSYYLPENLRRPHHLPFCVGQKQKWFLLQLEADDGSICFNKTAYPEFTTWCWVNYWIPLEQVVSFKKEVYKKALAELESLLF
jgi:putative (di)nucleoside polyphosphate hydrolase